MRYYIECNEKISNSRKRRSPIVCRSEAPTATVTSAGTKSMRITGEITTNLAWNADLADSASEIYKNSATSVEKDLTELIEYSKDVLKSNVTVTGFSEQSSLRKRRHRSVNMASVEFVAVITVRESKLVNEIETSLGNAIKANIDHFDTFDTFDSFSVTISDETSLTMTTETIVAPTDSITKSTETLFHIEDFESLL